KCCAMLASCRGARQEGRIAQGGERTFLRPLPTGSQALTPPRFVRNLSASMRGTRAVNRPARTKKYRGASEGGRRTIWRSPRPDVNADLVNWRARSRELSRAASECVPLL